MYEFMRTIPLFADLPEGDLRRLCESIETVKLPAGEELFQEGSEGDRAYVIRSGVVEIFKTASGREVLLAVRGDGTVIGEMALMGASGRTATVRARENAVFYAIRKEDFDGLLTSSPAAMRAMFQTVLKRLRENQNQMRQSEKMAQLGTLTAGVAHELNNPAAAVKRGADHLQNILAELTQCYWEIGRLDLEQGQREKLLALREQARQAATSPPPELGALERSDRESALESWLSDRGVAEPWEAAPALVEMGLEESALQALAEGFPQESLPLVIGWLRATYEAHNLLDEISQGSGRISAIVKALKSYSYLDQAPVQAVDVNEGLDDTLVILRNKLKQSVSVKREFAPDLPKIQAYGGELNQVWTNIIDNAIDALDGREDQQITVRTRREGSWVVVEIEDNGPGISPEDLPRIFDAFFTTKPLGKGTGLGLDISYSIVVNKHRGDIKVFSEPGKTCFQVWLPLNFEAKQGGDGKR